MFRESWGNSQVQIESCKREIVWEHNQIKANESCKKNESYEKSRVRYESMNHLENESCEKTQGVNPNMGSA